ncbi:MAG: tetratricopeptide repeat protein, partial [Rhodospirillales bacterium]
MSPLSQSDRQALLKAAVERFQAGARDEADDLCRRLLDADPDDAEALHLLGLSRHMAGDHDEAIALINKAIAAGPNAPFLNNLGLVYKAAERHAEAADCFRRALEIDPAPADVHANLGNALLDQGLFADALENFRRVLEREPGHREARGNVGIALYGLGEADQAYEIFEKTLAADPDDAIALAATGAILFERGEFEEAGRRLRRAADVDERFDYGRACLLGDEFRARTGPAAFGHALAELPEMAGDTPDPEGAGPVIMTSCDHPYFREFGRALALSVDRHAPGSDLHLHVINPEPSFAGELEALRERLPSTALSVTTETAPAAGLLYYPVVRFIRLGQILERTERDFLHLDADSLIRGPLASLGAIDAAADLAVPTRFHEFALKYKVLISSLLVRDTPGARRFMRRYGAYLGDCILAGRLVWCLDQTAFYIVHRMMEFDGEG